MYYARISGAADNVQLYQLQLAATALSTILAGVPEPAGVVLLFFAAIARLLLSARRRQQRA